MISNPYGNMLHKKEVLVMKRNIPHSACIISIPVVILIAFGLTGCETHPVSLSDSREVIASHILDQPSDVATSIEQGGRIVVTRDKGNLGSAELLKLCVDGTPVAKRSRYERYEVLLKEGEHVLTVAPNSNPFGLSIHETSVIVKNGQTYYFRIGYDYYGAVILRSGFTSGHRYQDLAD